MYGGLSSVWVADAIRVYVSRTTRLWAKECFTFSLVMLKKTKFFHEFSSITIRWESDEFKVTQLIAKVNCLIEHHHSTWVTQPCMSIEAAQKSGEVPAFKNTTMEAPTRVERTQRHGHGDNTDWQAFKIKSFQRRWTELINLVIVFSWKLWCSGNTVFL